MRYHLKWRRIVPSPMKRHHGRGKDEEEEVHMESQRVTIERGAFQREPAQMIEMGNTFQVEEGNIKKERKVFKKELKAKTEEKSLTVGKKQCEERKVSKGQR